LINKSINCAFISLDFSHVMDEQTGGY